jgi:putative heme iron utilization protein
MSDEELERVLARVQDARARRPRAGVAELAHELALPARLVMRALRDEAEAVDAVHLPALIETLRGWGRLRVVVRNPLAVAELHVDLAGARAERDGLTVVAGELEAHLPLLQARAAFFVVRPGHGQGLSRSVVFVGERGDADCQIYLWKTREDADYPEAQLRAFEEARRRFGEAKAKGGG